MYHLKSQFPHMQGLQACLLASSNKFRKQDSTKGTILQIINTELEGKGLHWIALSTLNCPDGSVNIYDSCNSCYVSDRVQAAIASLVGVSGRILTLRFTRSDNQLNMNDCGVLAIANLVSLCNDLDPSFLQYGTSQEMRKHLCECVQNRRFTVFPHEAFSDPDGDPLLSTHYIELFCTCKMPDDNRLYFECDRCEDWFHPHCQGLGHMSQKLIQRATLCCGPCTENKPSKRR